MKKFLFILLAVFVFGTEVNAASKCSYQEQTELNSKAANIKVMYEAKEDVTQSSFGDNIVAIHFEVSILNVSEEFYLVMSNKNDNTKKTYTSADASNGVIKFDWMDIEKVNNIEFEVFTTGKTSCEDESIRKIYVTLPRFNRYSESVICDDAKEFSMCQRYVTIDDFDFEKLSSQVIKYKEEHTKEEPKPPKEEISKKTNFIEEYKWYIIGGSSILIVGLAATLFKSKKQRDLDI